MKTVACLAGLFCSIALPLQSAPNPTEQLALYWEVQTSKIEQASSLRAVTSADHWNAQKNQARRQLADMMGLDPMPTKTPLNAQKTGLLEGDGFRVESIVFESMPKLYVTANLYLPPELKQPAPAILYVCGHSVMKKEGVSFGNKTGYHHHGVWFAKHGYVCMMVDTLQLGEVEGEHHGTHHLGKWWWQARGYTPAGVEAWNGIRALDYLETRTEVDPARFGVTGRSGGGATSWWVAALDERIRAAAPTAGITNLRDHLVGNCIDGHCDCMFFINTYRWDFDRVAALVAPRPLLVCNTDKDPIFPLDGVVDVFRNVRSLYSALGASKFLGLQIAEGPHKDVQPLNTGAFHWFERHLKGADPMATTAEAAVKVLQPEQLRVLRSKPADEKNTAIDMTFVTVAKIPQPPESMNVWKSMQKDWMSQLRSHVFAAWPELVKRTPEKIGSAPHGAGTLHAYTVRGEGPFELRLYAFIPRGCELPSQVEGTDFHILDEEKWRSFETAYQAALLRTGDPYVENVGAGNFPASGAEANATDQRRILLYGVPRGIGPLAWKQPKDNSIRRRFALLGSTVDSSQAWDICALLECARSMEALRNVPIHLHASKAMAVNAMYASLFVEPVSQITLTAPSHTHMAGPIYLNILRFLDCPQAAVLSAFRQPIKFVGADRSQWDWTIDTASKLGLRDGVTFVER